MLKFFWIRESLGYLKQTPFLHLEMLPFLNNRPEIIECLIIQHTPTTEDFGDTKVTIIS